MAKEKYHADNGEKNHLVKHKCRPHFMEDDELFLTRPGQSEYPVSGWYLSFQNFK
jgi:hypothetical protein